MTSQSNNFTGFSHYSREEVFRKLGLTITNTVETPVEPPKPEPVVEEVKEEPVIEEVQPEPVEEPVVIEEPQEQPTQEEVTEPEVNDTPEEAETTEEVRTPIEALDLKKTWLKILTANDINTVEDLALYFESGKSLADLPNLSAAAEKSINEKFEQWQNEQNQTK